MPTYIAIPRTPYDASAFYRKLLAVVYGEGWEPAEVVGDIASGLMGRSAAQLMVASYPAGQTHAWYVPRNEWELRDQASRVADNVEWTQEEVWDFVLDEELVNLAKYSEWPEAQTVITLDHRDTANARWERLAYLRKLARSRFFAAAQVRSDGSDEWMPLGQMLDFGVVGRLYDASQHPHGMAVSETQVRNALVRAEERIEHWYQSGEGHYA